MFAAELQQRIIRNHGINLENYLLPYEPYDVNIDNTYISIIPFKFFLVDTGIEPMASNLNLEWRTEAQSNTTKTKFMFEQVILKTKDLLCVKLFYHQNLYFEHKKRPELVIRQVTLTNAIFHLYSIFNLSLMQTIRRQYQQTLYYSHS